MWLTRDCILRACVAVKFKEADLSNLHNELNILKLLSKAKSDHPGPTCRAASLLLRPLWIDGPNGQHLVLVF